MITKDPAPGTTFLIVQVASLVRTLVKIILLVVENAFVTVMVEAAAAKLTVPETLLIVLSPVVPPAVIVVGSV